MKKYCFKVEYKTVTTTEVIADSEELALEELKGRWNGRTDLAVELSDVKDLQWMAQRCDIEMGAWYNDEYERIEKNHEKIGPFATADEALDAAREKWGFGSIVSKSWGGSYITTDSTGETIKDYTIWPKEVNHWPKDKVV